MFIYNLRRLFSPASRKEESQEERDPNFWKRRLDWVKFTRGYIAFLVKHINDTRQQIEKMKREKDKTFEYLVELGYEHEFYSAYRYYADEGNRTINDIKNTWNKLQEIDAEISFLTLKVRDLEKTLARVQQELEEHVS